MSGSDKRPDCRSCAVQTYVKHPFPCVNRHVPHGTLTPVSDKLRLAKNLRLARVGAGLSQIEVAKLVEKSRQTVSAWEREDETAASPDDADLEVLAKAYGTTRSALRYDADLLRRLPKQINEKPNAREDDEYQYDFGDARRAPASPSDGAFIPASLDIVSMEFQIEARKLDASEDDMLYIRNALRSPEAIRVFLGAPSEAQQLAEMQRAIGMLRGWLADRLKSRATARDSDRASPLERVADAPLAQVSAAHKKKAPAGKASARKQKGAG